MSDDEYVAVKEEVIESFEQSAEVYGLSRSAGRIYGVLYFAEEPLSIPELVEETGYAKSTISNTTRKLTRIGLVRRRSSDGGGRRVRFSPVTDFWVIVQDILQQYIKREMEMTARTLDRALRRLDDMDDLERQDNYEQLQELVVTYERLQTLLEQITTHSAEEVIEAIEQYEAEA